MTDATPVSAEAITPPQPRPYLARWLFDNGKSYRWLAPQLGVSPQAVNQWCRRFGDSGRIRPGRATLPRIEAVTGGGVPAWTFDDTPEARMAASYGPAAVNPPNSSGPRPASEEDARSARPMPPAGVRP